MVRMAVRRGSCCSRVVQDLHMVGGDKMPRWNIHEVIQKYGEHVYRDYEGFHDEETAERVKELVVMYTECLYFKDEEGNIKHEFVEVARDIVSNLLLEQMEYDEDTDIHDDIWNERTILLVDAVSSFLTVTEWTKSGVDWKAIERGEG